jgi:hypothetical protein
MRQDRRTALFVIATSAALGIAKCRAAAWKDEETNYTRDTLEERAPTDPPSNIVELFPKPIRLDRSRYRVQSPIHLVDGSSSQSGSPEAA